MPQIISSRLILPEPVLCFTHPTCKWSMGCLEWVLGPGRIQCLPPLLTKTAYVTTSCRDALTAKSKVGRGARSFVVPIIVPYSATNQAGTPLPAAGKYLSRIWPILGWVRRCPEIPSLVFVNFFRKENNLQELAILQLKHLCNTFPGECSPGVNLANK